MLEEKRIQDPLPGKDSMNFVEFALSQTTRTAQGNVIDLTDTILDPQTRKPIERKVTISPSEAYGLPNDTDELILLHWLAFTHQLNRFKDPYLAYTRYKVCKALGWSLNKKSYERIKLASLRWASTFYLYDRAWWDPEKGWLRKGFNIIDNINDWEKGNKDQCFIKWNDVVLESFQSGYIKGLDLDYIKSLKCATSWKLYRFVDKHAYRLTQDRKLVIELRNLAHTKLGIPAGVPLKEVKRILSRSVDELVMTGYLAPQSAEQTFIKRSMGLWDVALRPASRVSKPSTRPATTEKKPNTPKVQLTGLAQELAQRGVTGSRALELVGIYPEAQVREKIEVFDWLNETKNRLVSKNPAGYLVKAIAENYAPPQTFEAWAVREKREREAHEKHQALEEFQAETERQEVEAAAKKRAPILAYLKTLTPDQRALLENEAIGKGSAFYRKLLENGDGPAAAAVRQRLVDDHVSALLREQGISSS